MQITFSFKFQGKSNKTEQDMVSTDRSQQELETLEALEVVAVRGSLLSYFEIFRCLALGRVASRSTLS